ncbi:hypothetical protein ACFV6F_02565 [Kitasatospora phosalacinea]|uniref:hypothetical protein n=1 Tax=Kitasatospora phosalacinea TaxID=2065 RepID=UPI00366838A9
MAAVEASRGTAEAAPRRPPVRLPTTTGTTGTTSTTGHKAIGTVHPVTAFAFFLAGGVLALLVPAD